MLPVGGFTFVEREACQRQPRTFSLGRLLVLKGKRPTQRRCFIREQPKHRTHTFGFLAVDYEPARHQALDAPLPQGLEASTKEDERMESLSQPEPNTELQASHRC